jgi:type IV secretion system protein TrbL
MLAEGTSIANSIAGSSLTNTAAGIMTAGLTGTAGMVAGGTLAKTNPLKWKQTKAGFVSGASNAKEMAKDMGAVALGAGSAAVGGARLSKYAAYKIANAPKAGYNAYRGRKFNKGLSNMMSSNSETFEA